MSTVAVTVCRTLSSDPSGSLTEQCYAMGTRVSLREQASSSERNSPWVPLSHSPSATTVCFKQGVHIFTFQRIGLRSGTSVSGRLGRSVSRASRISLLDWAVDRGRVWARRRVRVEVRPRERTSMSGVGKGRGEEAGGIGSLFDPKELFSIGEEEGESLLPTLSRFPAPQ
eukprot:3556215-Rhodomonas_salina.1